MDDARFDRLIAAWSKAGDALEAYIAAPGRERDPALRRLLVQQLQRVAWRRYGMLCRYVAAERGRLREF